MALRKKGVHAAPLGAAYYAEHDFSAADLDSHDNKRKVIVPNFHPVSVGLAFQFANMDSRASVKVYATMFQNPPHYKVSDLVMTIMLFGFPPKVPPTPKMWVLTDSCIFRGMGLWLQAKDL